MAASCADAIARAQVWRRSVNVRLIAATNQHLEQAIQEGRFRADLYYPLSVFPIMLPPLRDRQCDVLALVEYFARRFAARQHTPLPRLTPEALDRLTAYSWPGNVRELQNIIERAVILARGGDIGPDLLTFPFAVKPQPITPPPPAAAASATDASSPASLFDAERQAILNAVRTTGSVAAMGRPEFSASNRRRYTPR